MEFVVLSVAFVAIFLAREVSLYRERQAVALERQSLLERIQRPEQPQPPPAPAQALRTAARAPDSDPDAEQFGLVGVILPDVGE